MFTPKFKTAPTKLEMELDELFDELKKHEKDSDKYAKVSAQILSLYRLKEVDTNSRSRVSADKLAEIAGSLIGILAVIQYEKIHVISTKAFGLVSKIR